MSLSSYVVNMFSLSCGKSNYDLNAWKGIRISERVSLLVVKNFGEIVANWTDGCHGKAVGAECEAN